MEQLSDVFLKSLAIRDIERILKEYMVYGKVIPYNKRRHSDCLVCVFGGKAVYNFSTYKVSVKEGDILYIAKDSTYFYNVMTPRYEYIYLDFNFIVPEGWQGRSCCFHMGQAKTNFYSIFERMNNLWLLQRPSDYVQCMSDLYQIYARLMKMSEKPYACNSSKKLSEKAATFILLNCTDKDFRIEQVAQSVGCSDVHLRRIFKRDYDISPLGYTTIVRMEKAKSLLKNSDYKISEISEMMGIQDSYHFSRVFRRVVGCSPTDYRKQ